MVTPANEQDRTQVQELARAGTANYWRDGRNCIRGSGVYRNLAASDAAAYGIQLEVVKLPPSKKGIRVAASSRSLSSEVLHGLGDSDDWQEIMND